MTTDDMITDGDPAGTTGRGRPSSGPVPDTYDGPDAPPPEHGETGEEAETKIGSVGRLGTSSGAGTGAGSSSREPDATGGSGTSDEA
jgi:hypothetical protein